jgi:4-carboxymuconolactone decarboxylase
MVGAALSRDRFACILLRHGLSDSDDLDPNLPLLNQTLKGIHTVSDDIVQKTKTTGALYFRGVEGEKPFELWRAFDKDLGKDLSLFITGKLYAREKIPHPTRQLVTVAVLTVLSRPEELELHIQAALNVGCTPQEIAEVIFQTFTYGGIPTVNTALKVLRDVLKEKGQWPIVDE